MIKRKRVEKTTRLDEAPQQTPRIERQKLARFQPNTKQNFFKANPKDQANSKNKKIKLEGFQNTLQVKQKVINCKLKSPDFWLNPQGNYDFSQAKYFFPHW